MRAPALRMEVSTTAARRGVACECTACCAVQQAVEREPTGGRLAWLQNDVVRSKSEGCAGNGRAMETKG